MEKSKRPFKEFNRKDFEFLCRILCTQKEICDFFGTTDKTLTGWVKREYGKPYMEVYDMFASEGKVSLRRQQVIKAEKGNVPMLIWLGRQWLGQKDYEKLEKESELPYEDDGFMDALKGSADDDWQTEDN